MNALPSPHASLTPHGLWSLWELMLKQAALEFGRAVAQLAVMEVGCHYARQSQPHVLIDSSGTLEQSARDILGNLKRVCILSDMQEVLPEIDRFAQSLNGQAKIEQIGSSAAHLKFRLLDDLQADFYFQVDRPDVPLYGQPLAFGEAVAKKFKTVLPEIENAGNCLALRQPTACVFHLMRAMEGAVRTLGRRLNMTIAPQTTWRQLTGGMDGKIRGMPERNDREKKKKEAWEAARANLHHVGSVWRNSTMHPGKSYTRSQAHDVYAAVRVFMNGLCAL
jgi:hypothetical protein